MWTKKSKPVLYRASLVISKLVGRHHYACHCIPLPTFAFAHLLKGLASEAWSSWFRRGFPSFPKAADVQLKAARGKQREQLIPAEKVATLTESLLALPGAGGSLRPKRLPSLRRG